MKLTIWSWRQQQQQEQQDREGPQGPQGLPGPGLAKTSRNTYAQIIKRK